MIYRIKRAPRTMNDILFHLAHRMMLGFIYFLGKRLPSRFWHRDIIKNINITKGLSSEDL